MRRPVIRDAFADDYAGIVDRLGDGEQAKIASVEIRERVQVRHLAVRKKKRMHRSIFGRGKADNQSRSVDSESAALVATERAEIGGVFVGALKSVISRGFGDVRSPNQIRRIICIRRTPRATEGPEILHFSIFIKEGVHRSVRDQGGTHDVSGGVDAIGGAGRAAKRTEIRDVEGQLRQKSIAKKQGEEDRTENDSFCVHF